MSSRNYRTSQIIKYTKLKRRYRVLYDDGEEDCFSFSVFARSASEAVALTVEYIDRRKLHTSDEPYFLTPSIASKLIKTIYTVN